MKNLRRANIGKGLLKKIEEGWNRRTAEQGTVEQTKCFGSDFLSTYG